MNKILAIIGIVCAVLSIWLNLSARKDEKRLQESRLKQSDDADNECDDCDG